MYKFFVTLEMSDFLKISLMHPYSIKALIYLFNKNKKTKMILNFERYCTLSL